jgi:hypothetical protein
MEECKFCTGGEVKREDLIRIAKELGIDTHECGEGGCRILPNDEIRTRIQQYFSDKLQKEGNK